MRISVKVEKTEMYSGEKTHDLDTWLFQVREHLNITTIPARGHVPYAASLLRGNAALWWHETCEGNHRPATWDGFLPDATGTVSARRLRKMQTRRAHNNAAVWQRKHGRLCLQILRHVPQNSRLVRGGDDGSLCPCTGSKYPFASGAARAPEFS